MSCITGKHHKWVNSLESRSFRDPYYARKYHRCFYCFKYRYEVKRKQREMTKNRKNKDMLRATGGTDNGN